MTQSDKQMVREPLKVILYLPHYKITGTIYLALDERLTDYLNSGQTRFIPVADAHIESLKHEVKFTHDAHFLSVNTERILFITPLEKEDQVEEASLIHKIFK